MTKFIVAGIQRTGTTLITTSLNSHPDVHCAGELFKMIRSTWNDDVLDSGYRAYLDTAIGLRVKDYFLRRRLVPDFLDRYFNQPDFGAIGFKLMFNQTRPDRFPMVLPYLIERQVRVIHVLRENVLRTYVSRLMAAHRRVYHATQRAAGLPKLVVPVGDLEPTLVKIAGDGKALSDTFGGRVPYLAVTYESYLANTETEDQRMLSFLEVPLTRLRSPLVRINPDNLSQIVANWEEVRHRLQDTQFAKSIEDST